jgi:hypothetical protein
MTTLTTLASFTGANGSSPAGGLVADAAGNLFGTTQSGGQGTAGTVFEIPYVNGGYGAVTVLVAFNGANGAAPSGTLSVDANGNLFGATASGGANGNGTVFEIARTTTGYATTPITLVSFNSANGAQPLGDLILDASGNLYGTTNSGGTNLDGTVFEIPLTAAGYATSPSVLVNFSNSDGNQPLGGLIADANGNLFGTTSFGGTAFKGAVFEIAKTAAGYSSTPTILASFQGPDGNHPYGDLIADSAGNLFGTTEFGGAGNSGTVFELARTATGYASSVTTLASFNGTNGNSPFGGLVADSAGNLFGTTQTGGANNLGTVFEIVRTASGYAATPVTLFSFGGANGVSPSGSLTITASGDILGTTYGDTATGGTIAGTAFRLSGVAGVGSVSGVGSSLPDVSASFTSAVYAVLQSTLAARQPAGTSPVVVSVAGGGAAPAASAGVLNAYVVTVAGAGAASTVPAGYAAGYLLSGAATLQDAGGGGVLIAAAANATLLGQANDVLFGGNANETMIASNGAETLFGGTGANLIELGASTATADTQGADTIIGSSGSATINASGAPIYFGGTGTALFNALSTTATLVGGSGNQTVNAGAANIEMFAGAGLLTFNAGSGASTVVSGSGGASLTGGTGGLLYFGTGPSTYTAGTAVDTVLGFTGSLTATGGANGTLFFTGTAGNNNVSTGTGSTTIIGFGANNTLTATGAGNNVIAASGDAGTINGANSTGNNTFFAFGATDVVIGGSGQTAMESGLGNHTLIAGSGSTLFEILAGTLNRQITIGNFDVTQDFVKLQGYDTGAGAAALASAVTTGGSEVLTLSDGTSITFTGVTNLHASSFV